MEEPFTAAVRKASFAAQCVVDGHWRTVGEMLVTAQYLPEAATHGLWVASIEYIYVLPRFHRRGVAARARFAHRFLRARWTSFRFVKSSMSSAMVDSSSTGS